MKLPVDIWLCHKMGELNLTIVEGTPPGVQRQVDCQGPVCQDTLITDSLV